VDGAEDVEDTDEETKPDDSDEKKEEKAFITL
jgi:hypothetical protein